MTYALSETRNPLWHLLSMFEPFTGNALDTRVHHHDATDNGARGVTITQSAHRGPKCFFIVAQVAGGTPQCKRNRVGRRHGGAISKSCHSGFYGLVPLQGHAFLA